MTFHTSKSWWSGRKERLEYLTDIIGLSEEEAKLLVPSETFELEMADRMIENVIGFMPIPLGIAKGLVVNGREYLVPMATEQRSVISMVAKVDCFFWVIVYIAGKFFAQETVINTPTSCAFSVNVACV